MNNKSIFLLLLIAAVFAGVGSSAFIITEKERAVMLKFGEVVNPDVQPGLHWRVPLMHTVRKFDARVITRDAKPERFFTSEKKTLIVDAFIQWKISDTQKFYTAMSGDIGLANSILESRVNEGLRNQFGRRTLHEVVSGERDQLMSDLVAEMDKVTEEDLGIEIVDIRVKAIDLPETVSADVFNRMNAERKQEAEKFRSNGKKEAELIRATADRQKTVIEANGYKTAQALRGEGDALAASVYANAFGKDAEFYDFTRSLRAYEESMSGGNDIMVVAPDSEYFKYLKDSKGGL